MSKRAERNITKLLNQKVLIFLFFDEIIALEVTQQIQVFSGFKYAQGSH